MRRHVLLAAALLFAPSLAHACPNVVGGDSAVDAVDETTRRRWLDQTLGHESSRADLWTWGWVTAGVVGTGVNVGLGATGNYDARIDRFGAAAGTLALSVTTLVQPLRVGSQGHDDGDACTAVHRREKLLLSLAEDEVRGQGWFAHLLPITGSILGGVALGVGYGHWTGGAINAAIGIAVSELKILTQPMGGVRGLERYRAGVLTTDGPIGLTVTPILGNQGGGAALTLSY